MQMQYLLVLLYRMRKQFFRFKTGMSRDACVTWFREERLRCRCRYSTTRNGDCGVMKNVLTRISNFQLSKCFIIIASVVSSMLSYRPYVREAMGSNTGSGF